MIKENEEMSYTLTLTGSRMIKLKIGYIAKYDLKLNPHLKGRFEFKEATYTRKINSRGDKIYSKLLAYPFDYEEVADNADIMKKNDSIILVQEPFLLDDELREKVIKWVEWANQADPKEYDPWAKYKEG